MLRLPIRKALRDESGMTMVELMIAAMICVVGLLATVAVLDQSRRVGDDAETRETITHQADRELERIIALSWPQVAHTQNPTASGTAPDPASYVVGNQYRFDRSDLARTEPFAIQATGLVNHVPTPWVDNQSRLEGTVYRYVTEINARARRVTVAVTADAPSTVPPVVLSTLVTDPQA